MTCFKALARTAITMLLLFAGACADGPSPDPASETPSPVLRFSAIPDQNTTELREKFKPLAEHLASVLGVPVEYIPARDYQASVELFRNGDAHLAWFGGLTGVQARDAVPGARAIAQGEADPRYYSYFIAHRDTGLERAEALPTNIGRYRFTYGSESSTSGRLMPEYFLRQHLNTSPSDAFANPIGFSGSHDKTVELVESGQYEIGAVNYKVYERRVAAGQTDPDVARIIWKTPYYADYNWTVRPDVDDLFGAGFIDRLQTALIAIDDPDLLAALPRDRLIAARNEDFDSIRVVARELGMLR